MGNIQIFLKHFTEYKENKIVLIFNYIIALVICILISHLDALKDCVDSQIIIEILGEFPLIGFYGGYELAQMPQGVQLYTYTGVLVLVYL